MQRMNEVWWTLEDITDILAEMSDLLANDPENQAMRTTPNSSGHSIRF